MSDAAAATRPPLSFTSKLSYSIGSVAYGLKGVALGSVLLYYNQVLGLPVVWVSQGIGAALIVDAIVHPIVGQVSDMWRSRWGRRHPFMYVSALPISLAVLLLLNPPAALTGFDLFLYMMGCLIVARVCLAMFEVPNSSLLPEIVSNYNERTTLLSYRYFMGVFAPVVAHVIALRVIFRPFFDKQGHHMPGQLNPAAYGPFGIALALIIFAAIMVSALGTHREIKYMRAPEKHPSAGALLGAIATTLFNRNFIALTAAGVIYAVGTGLVGALGAYFSTYFWELSANQLSLIAGANIIAPFVAVPLGPFLARRLGKKTAVLMNFYASVFIGVLPISLRLLGILPPNGDPIILPILIADGVLSATLGIMGFIIVSSMMADIVEQVQVKTGKRSEGLLFSADALLRQIVSGVGVMGTGYVLAAVGFPAHAIPGQVPAQVLTNLALAYLPIMTLSSLLAISTISFYSISRAQHEKNLANIDKATVLEGAPEATRQGEDLTVASHPI